MLLSGVSRQIAELKDSYEEKLENTFELYKDALKEHAYQCAMDRLEEDYIPIEEYNTAQGREQVTQIHMAADHGAQESKPIGLC